MTQYEQIHLLILAVSAIVGLGMIGIGLRQIREIATQVRVAAEANTIARLNALLSLEDHIAERRLRLSEAGIAVAELGKMSPILVEKMESAQLRFDEATQMYLNALDRLCFCLLQGLLIEEELRSEYREVVNAAVKDFKGKFDTGTDYRNIKKLYEKWADQ